MQIRITGNGVAEQLFATERALDEAINQAASMARLLPIARTEAKLSAVIGQSAFDRASSTLASLTSARKELVALHQELDDVKNQVGLRQVAYGGEDKPPPENALTPALKVVASGGA